MTAAMVRSEAADDNAWLYARRVNPYAGQRMDWAPLERYLIHAFELMRDPHMEKATRGHRLTDMGLGQVLGVHRRQIARWRGYGVPWVTADQLATRLGLHPANLWPEWNQVPEHDGVEPMNEEELWHGSTAALAAV